MLVLTFANTPLQAGTSCYTSGDDLCVVDVANNEVTVTVVTAANPITVTLQGYAMAF
jgi:hypothetical protein